MWLITQQGKLAQSMSTLKRSQHAYPGGYHGGSRRGRVTAQADEHDEQEPALAGNLDVFAAHGILGSDF